VTIRPPFLIVKLRRGIPFGPPHDRLRPDRSDNAKERGLLFRADQRSIAQQFEMLNMRWMVNDDVRPTALATMVGQLDVGGAAQPKQAAFHRGGVNPGVPFTAIRQWMTPTGGAYLFAPSASPVRQITLVRGLAS
jgi:deferrochelatase/peroxidase EfeB